MRFFCLSNLDLSAPAYYQANFLHFKEIPQQIPHHGNDWVTAKNSDVNVKPLMLLLFFTDTKRQDSGGVIVSLCFLVRVLGTIC